MHPVRVLRIVTMLLWLAAPAARAEPPPARAPAAEPDGYKQAVNDGIEEFRRGNFEEAREHFARAHGLFPNARTLRGLGMSEFELRNYVDAAQRLEQSLASNLRPLDGALRAETEELLARASGYVGELRLRVTPASARLHVDGFPPQVGDDGRVRLSVGDHVLELHAEGYLAERRAFKIRGAQVLDLQVALARPGDALAMNQAAPPSTDRADTAAAPLYKRWWLWTSVGALVVGGVVAGALLASRGGREQDPYRGTVGDAIVVK